MHWLRSYIARIGDSNVPAYNKLKHDAILLWLYPALAIKEYRTCKAAATLTLYIKQNSNIRYAWSTSICLLKTNRDSFSTCVTQK